MILKGFNGPIYPRKGKDAIAMELTCITGTLSLGKCVFTLDIASLFIVVLPYRRSQ